MDKETSSHYKRPESPHCNLDHSPINLKALREQTKQSLTELLQKIDCASGINNKKALVLDPSLTGPLGLAVEFDFLRDQGVDKLFLLSLGTITVPNYIKHVIFLVRSQSECIKLLTHQVNQLKEPGRSFSAIAVPNWSLPQRNMLKSSGIKEDVISMEVPSYLHEIFINKDPSALHYVASSLMKLQNIYGIIPHVKGKGIAAKKIAKVMLQMRSGQLIEQRAKTPSEAKISHLILLDRFVDPVTPLLTMLTYEGLVDEVYSINNGNVELPPEMVLEKKRKNQGQDEGSNKKLKVPLNNNDPIFNEIRDLNFTRVGPILSAKAKSIGEYYNKRHESQSMVALKQYIGQFAHYQQQHRCLQVYTNIMDGILKWTTESDFYKQLEAEQTVLVQESNNPVSMLNYIQECINRQESLVKVLRLICLMYLCTKGLKEKVYNALVKDLVQAYGLPTLFALNNLESTLLGRSGEESLAKTSNWFQQIREPLQTVVTNLNEREMVSMAYVYSGYAPISTRLVQCALSVNHTDEKQKSKTFISGQNHAPTKGVKQPVIRPTWGLSETAEETIGLIPGELFSFNQSTFRLSHPNSPLDDESLWSQLPSGLSESLPVCLVVFVGGVTYSEISALRWLSAKSKVHIIIGTTNFINGNKLINCICDEKMMQKVDLATKCYTMRDADESAN